MKYISVLILLVASATVGAAQTFNCDDIPGWWQGERFEHELGLNVAETIVLGDAGTFGVQFNSDDGVIQRTQYEIGHWSCDGDKLITTVTSVNGQDILFIAIYDILELNTAYMKIALEHADCSMVYGKCEGAVYELIRIPEPEYEDGC
jgi:hypothetical protein